MKLFGRIRTWNIRNMLKNLLHGTAAIIGIVSFGYLVYFLDNNQKNSKAHRQVEAFEACVANESCQLTGEDMYLYNKAKARLNLQ